MAANRIRETVSRHYRYFIVGGLFLVLVILLVIFLLTRGTNVAKDGENSGIGDVTSSVEVPNDKYEVDAYPLVNNICTSYMDAMAHGDSDTMASLSNALSDERRAFFEAQAQYLTNYTDYHFYTKKGPVDNSYLVLITYNLQIVDDVNKLPALCSLYVCTDGQGNLFINNADMSADEEAYILALASQDDFKELQDGVQLEYNEIIDNNPDIANRVTELRGRISSDVQVKLEAKKQAETEAAAAAAAQEAAAAQAAAATRVRATTGVNIRASASTEADSLGKATAGQEFTRYEVMDNGWSKIEYNGSEAYIKTEYLEEIADASAEGGEGAEAAAPREPGSMITIKENVRIRAQANTDSEVYETASAGTQFKLISEENGWCKIEYKGKEAYVKSDFVK